MPVEFNVRHVEKRNVQLHGELPVAELELDGLDDCIAAKRPLKYNLEAELMDDGYLIQGELVLTLDCDCVRCLKTFEYPVELKDWACHLSLTGEDAVKVVDDVVDLTSQIREDILLMFPQYPLCGPGCQGPPKQTFGGGSQPEADVSEKQVSTAWAELNKLKF